MRKILLIILFFIFSLCTFSQTIELTAENADCKGAIDISNRTEIIASAPISAGLFNEISSYKGDVYYFNKEHNTVWYSFIADQDAILSFTITPDKSTDDYDFILFECPLTDCCTGIKNKKLKPIRTNISRTKVLADGITGLNDIASKKYVHEGKGDNFSKSVKLIEGTMYLLLLDNVYGGKGGHKINMQYNAIDDTKEKFGDAKLNLKIVEKDSNQLIDANITIIKFDNNYNTDTISKKNTSSLSFPLNIDDFYTIKITKKNYLYKEVSFKVGPNDTLISETVELTKIMIGSSFALKNLYFVGGTAQFTGKFKNTLIKLQRILRDNPSLKIMIRGHVNRPSGFYKRKSEEHYNQLSIARAKAVYDYLIKRGISKIRLQYQGVGYAEMLYPDAKLKSEMQQNRRVEIVVTDF